MKIALAECREIGRSGEERVGREGLTRVVDERDQNLNDGLPSAPASHRKGLIFIGRHPNLRGLSSGRNARMDPKLEPPWCGNRFEHERSRLHPNPELTRLGQRKVVVV